MAYRGQLATVIVVALAAGGCGSSSSKTSTVNANKNSGNTPAATTTSSGNAPTTASNSSASSFKSSYAQLSKKYKPLGLQIGKTLVGANSKSNQQLGSELRTESAELGKAQQAYSALHPPAALAPTFKNYVSTLGSARSDLTNIAQAAQSNNAAAAKSDARKLITDLKGTNQTSTALKTKLGLPASS